MTDFTKNIVSKKVIALMKAAAKVRGGAWIDGAPSHIFPAFLAELEKDGWKLINPYIEEREILAAEWDEQDRLIHHSPEDNCDWCDHRRQAWKERERCAKE